MARPDGAWDAAEREEAGAGARLAVATTPRMGRGKSRFHGRDARPGRMLAARAVAALAVGHVAFKHQVAIVFSEQPQVLGRTDLIVALGNVHGSSFCW